MNMKRIFLIGYMGAGKTTVGKVIAGFLNLSFIDLDYYIERRYHKTVSQLFAEKGDEAFLSIERYMLQDVATKRLGSLHTKFRHAIRSRHNYSITWIVAIDITK